MFAETKTENDSTKKSVLEDRKFFLQVHYILTTKSQANKIRPSLSGS